MQSDSKIEEEETFFSLDSSQNIDRFDSLAERKVDTHSLVSSTFISMEADPSTSGAMGAPKPTVRFCEVVFSDEPPSKSETPRFYGGRASLRKAKRVTFFRNGDRFFPGVMVPITRERYRSFDSLVEDLIRLLKNCVKLPGAIRKIYSIYGNIISSLEGFEDGESYICSCNNENFKRIDYKITAAPAASSKVPCSRNKSPSNKSILKTGRCVSAGRVVGDVVESERGGIEVDRPAANRTDRNVVRFDNVVHPRLIILIRNGTKPRRVVRLLLNKRNSPSFDHILTAITNVVKLNSGYVKKIFMLSGKLVAEMADFFGDDDLFLACGASRVNSRHDFILHTKEEEAIQAIRKPLLRFTSARDPASNLSGKRKSQKHQQKREIDQATQCLSESCIDVEKFAPEIRDRYLVRQVIGIGSFATVLKIEERESGLPYALKIIDKGKLKGKEEFLEAEIRVMKKVKHSNIVSLIMDIDQPATMNLIIEYVSGGNLYSAIQEARCFSEDQSRLMIRDLATALSYLHSLNIVHRDVKLENLLLEFDYGGNITVLKLADFGLACEVSDPLRIICGSPTYVAPEILLEVGYGLKVDIWAAGIILYALLCGVPPFVSPNGDVEQLFQAIIAGSYDFRHPKWAYIGHSVQDLISHMLEYDPAIRFSSDDVLRHDWIVNSGS